MLRMLGRYSDRLPDLSGGLSVEPAEQHALTKQATVCHTWPSPAPTPSDAAYRAAAESAHDTGGRGRSRDAVFSYST